MMTVLVTGAGGYLGRRVVVALERAGYRVRAGVRRTVLAAPLGWGAAVVQSRCDLLTGDGLADACEGVDTVIHLAADMSGDEANKVTTAVAGTERLIAALGPSTTRMVLASSFSVYDWERVGAALDENDALLDAAAAARQDGYARAKLMQEQLTRAACGARHLELVVMRPATIWSAARRSLDGVGIGAGKATVVIGPGRLLRLTHVDNCASAFVAALDPRAAGHTFNVDDGYPITAWDFAGLQSDALRLPLPYGLARAGAALGAVLLPPLMRGRPMPGLLVPARLCARFHGARAGHAELTRVLGWTPPLPYETCLRTG